nr:cystatin-9-like [Vulpes vulpes]
MEIFLSATVEYALHVFNLQSNDTKAYRLVRILDSRIEQIITCFFTISTDPWNTIFELWNKTCLEGGSLS